MLVETFPHVLGNFFLTQTDHFSKAIAFVLSIFFQFSKSFHFSKIMRFLERFFAENVCNVLIQEFFPCFRQCYFLTQNDQFAKAIAFVLWPVFQFSKSSHFSNINCFLEPFFA